MSDPVTTTVIDPDQLSTIAEARAGGNGWYGTIRGNVTVLPGTFAARSFTIQDETGGLYIYPPYGAVIPPLSLGDVVQVKGIISVYHGLLELSTVDYINWIDTGTVPDPLVTPTGGLAPTQGKLVQIQGTALSMTGTTNKTILINDGSGQTSVYIYGLTGIDTSSFSFPMQMRVTGMSGAYDTPQVNPRFQADIVDLRPPTVSATDPVDAALDVNLYRPLYATFSKAMDPSSLTAATFTLVDLNGAVNGSVGYDAGSFTASFTPSAAPVAIHRLHRHADHGGKRCVRHSPGRAVCVELYHRRCGCDPSRHRGSIPARRCNRGGANCECGYHIHRRYASVIPGLRNTSSLRDHSVLFHTT